VAVVVAGDSFDESHQGVGAGRPAHLGEPLLQAMRLVFADISEYRGWIQKKVRDRLDSAIACGSNKLIHGGVVESPRPAVTPAESR
jgi:hypothetical protein